MSNMSRQSDNPWRKLAAMTEPCPECQVAPGWNGVSAPLPSDCDICHGTGQVPLIPGLTRQCADEDGAMQTYVRSGPEAVVAAQEFILNRLTGSEDYWDLHVSHYKDGYTAFISNDWGEIARSDPQPTYAAALAQALKRALEKKQ